jgi:mono/diheme cytochrome c family protein
MFAHMTWSWQFAVIAALAAPVSCSKNNEPPPASTGGFGAQQETGPGRKPLGTSKTPLQTARALYATLCVSCHGPEGRGDGPMASQLDPKPRNYADPAWQTSISDDEIKAIIVKGGAGVGKSKWMPGQPQLEGDPQLDALVQVIRGFGKGPPENKSSSEAQQAGADRERARSDRPSRTRRYGDRDSEDESRELPGLRSRSRSNYYPAGPKSSSGTEP